MWRDIIGALTMIMLIVMVTTTVYAMSDYERGYRNGCADHIRGSSYWLLLPTRDYARGYDAGYYNCQ